MSEPRKLHLRHPPAVPHAEPASVPLPGGRRAIIPVEKRHSPSLPPSGSPRRFAPDRKIVFAIFGVVVVAAIGFGLYKFVEERRIAGRKEALALKSERDKVEAQFASFQPLVERVAAMLTEATAAEAGARDAVQFITGEPLPPLQADPRKRAPRPATTGAAKPEAAPGSDAPAAPPPVREVVGDREQPEGVESLADLERRRQQEQARQGVNRPEPGDSASAVVPAQPPESPAPAEPQAVPAPPPEASGTEIVRLARNIESLAVEIREQGAAIETARAEAESTGNDAMRARTSAEAAASEAKLRDQVASAENKAGQAAAALDQVRMAAARVLELRSAEERARKQSEEEALRQKAAEDHAALVESEKARAAELHKGALPLIEKYDFAQARSEMETALAAMRTDPGRAALGPIVERYRKLETTKEALIRLLNEKPFRWGWGTGATATDVRGADADSVDAAGKRVPWAEVSLAQMVKLLEHYQSDTTERLRVRADLALATAILLDENGRKEEALEHVKRARQLGEYGTAEVARTLPDY